VLAVLRVDNLVLIRSAELELAPGLTVITGETGAGKTILAEAVGLLLGGKGDAALVGPAGREAYVEAAFEGVDPASLPEVLAGLRPDDADELVLARRVVADGRSRALVWGRSCARADLEAAGGGLVEIVSQHEARRLARPSVQLDLLDAAGGAPSAGLRIRMAEAWRALSEARRVEADAVACAGERARDLAELEALVETLDALEAEPGEDEALRAERERLRHVDDLYAAAAGAAEAINPEDGAGALLLAGEAARLVEGVTALDATLEAPAVELREAAERLQEAALMLRGYAGALDASPGRLEAVETRLEALADARRRFDCETLTDLLARGETARAELEAEGEGGGRLAALAAAREAAEREATAVAEELGALRRKTARRFRKAVESHLAELGMAGAELHVELADRDLGPRGGDAVSLLLRANNGLPAVPLGTGASGGELSRIALAVRLAARDPAAAETLVFDEVDAGIGGVTARVLGEKLRRLAETAQLVVITHLPQIAALADRHYRVEKRAGSRSETRIERLEGDAVLTELVRMLGAEQHDEGALALATSLRARAA
jgi:DNA repair protein RecN (Recombination protein N)